jgi:hypothetical protein
MQLRLHHIPLIKAIHCKGFWKGGENRLHIRVEGKTMQAEKTAPAILVQSTL